MLREHRFADGIVGPAAGGSRAAQIAGGRRARRRAWAARGSTTSHAYADDWEVLRREYLERPWDPDHLPAPAGRAARRAARRWRVGSAGLKDERLRLMALHPAVAEGHDPRDVPAWVGVTAYVEQRFGAWTVPGGMAALADALARTAGDPQGRGPHRTRRPRPRASRRAGGRGRHRPTGELDADVVVVACDPRRLPALAPLVQRTMPALPPVVCHLGLEGELPVLAHETVLHG